MAALHKLMTLMRASPLPLAKATQGKFRERRTLQSNDARTELPHFGISALGSGVAAGVLGPEILDIKDDNGLTVAEWLRRYGQDPAHLTDARIAPGALAAILELHIEQGPVLEGSKVQIGVVSGIVSLKRWKCVVAGFANHAGTTPMNRRKDALAASAKNLLAVRDVVRAQSGTQVGTVGYT